MESLVPFTVEAQKEAAQHGLDEKKQSFECLSSELEAKKNLLKKIQEGIKTDEVSNNYIYFIILLGI